MSMICVPIMVEEANNALLDASLAQAKGADLVEYRVDLLFEERDGESLEVRIDRVLELAKESPLPCIITCRPHWEGGDYHGDDDERVSLYEALGTSDHPPAYIDVELATYTRSANIRQKVNLAVDHPKQQRNVTTRLILSSHDFEGRPSDLTRKIVAMNDEPTCAVVKIAYRARSIRDNLEVFEILRDRQKPMIALCMGEFGLMSRVLAPKFGGLLTFASLRDEEMTAPGQPTLDDLLNLYRFRSITATTKVYGIIGWPVTQSMSPLVHNAGFEKIGWDGVYVPMPVEGSYESFKATMLAIVDSDLDFTGASVTIPHKIHAASLAAEQGWLKDFADWPPVAINTLSVHDIENINIANTDSEAIKCLISDAEFDAGWFFSRPVIIGTGGVARSAAVGSWPTETYITGRNASKADQLVSELQQYTTKVEHLEHPWIQRLSNLSDAPSKFAVFINCTPVGMTGGPDPDGLSIPIPDMPPLPPETVFFDTVYNPIETPMLKAAKERGYRTIDGVQMFVKQAEAQFQLWTGQNPPDGLFDQLVRRKLSETDPE